MRVTRKLAELYPEAECALVHDSPLELLIATILSAQCTDARVNIVTKDLFQKYRSAEDFARAPLPQLERAVKTTGFFRNKAKNIKACCQQLVDKHGGEVPRDMESLVVLAGVGEDGQRGTGHRLRHPLGRGGRYARLAAEQPDGANREQRPGQDRTRSDPRAAGKRVDRLQPPDDPARPAGLHGTLAAMRRLRPGGHLPTDRCRRSKGGESSVCEDGKGQREQEGEEDSRRQE